VNQILAIGQEPERKKTRETNPKYSGGQKADITKVMRIFSVIIIIFGIVLIGKSTYAFISKKNNLKDTPQVQIEKMGKEATIKIGTEKPIKEYSYRWNEGESTTVQGNGRISVEETIQIPNGNNILNLTVVDYYGNKTTYKKQYIYESTDINKPTIDIGISGSKLQIKATDDTEMGYMTYAWNDDEPTRIEVSSDDKKTITAEIDVPQGQSKLTVIAVDKEENKTTRTENIIGDTKPTFKASVSNSKLIIEAEDDQGISSLSINVDGQVTDSGDTPINQTNITAELTLTSGNHTITITVTNVNGLAETKTMTANV
jgi:hypothetical protein